MLFTKYFKEAHRFSFKSLEKLEEEGEKMLRHALEVYQKEAA